MKSGPTPIVLAVSAMFCCASPLANAQGKPSNPENREVIEQRLAGEQEAQAPAAKLDPAYWALEATRILDEQMTQDVDKRIPVALLNKAKCAAVFPQLIQVGVGIGAKKGTGMVSCRQASGRWGAPMFIDVTGLSFGAQIGVKGSEAVVLAMTDEGLDQLFAGKPVAEGELGVTAGPVGRAAQVGLDVLLKTPLISYVRSKGLFAGATVGGSVMSSRHETNLDLYGEYDNPRRILFGEKETPPTVAAMPGKLDQFAPANK